MKMASGISPSSDGPSHSRGAATKSTSAATMAASATCARPSRSNRGSPEVGTRQERNGAGIRKELRVRNLDWRCGGRVRYDLRDLHPKEMPYEDTAARCVKMVGAAASRLRIRYTGDRDCLGVGRIHARAASETGHGKVRGACRQNQGPSRRDGGCVAL